MIFRKAEMDDLPKIVEMLAADDLGRTREDFSSPLNAKYYKAFEYIDRDSMQELVVLDDENQGVIGTFHLSFIQYLTYQGGIRAQIEGVRVRKDVRGLGHGKKMFEWAIIRAKEREAHLLQLTTDKKRPEALGFYKELGFTASHEGMKLHFKK